MRLRLDQFCGLATSPAWLAWLYEHTKDLYSGFTAHLQKKPSCRASSDKMKEILAIITAQPEDSTKLEMFLRANFPHVLDNAIPATVTNANVNQQLAAFKSLDPDIVTIPRRTVISGGKTEADAFLREQPVGRFLLHGNSVYIEYLTNELMPMVALIPEDAWLIKRHAK